MPKEPITPKKEESEESDEDFFKERGITEEEDKAAFRTRYQFEEYREYRQGKKKKEPEKKKRFFD